MTDIDKRLYDMLISESEKAAEWWYLSFATDEGWNGSCFVMARGLASAVLCSKILGINPGGEVLGLQLHPDAVPEEKYLCKLITSKEELEEATKDECKTLGELEDEETREAEEKKENGN